jgi:hypothetical protein
MARYICGECGLFLNPLQANVALLEKIGNENKKIGGPYRLWEADLWGCPGCGHQVVVVSADRPMLEREEPRLATTCLAYREEGRLYEGVHQVQERKADA